MSCVVGVVVPPQILGPIMNLQLKIILAALFCAIAVTVNADIKSVLAALESKNYTQALMEINILATRGRGDAEAQYLLGTMYSNGKGVPEDASTATLWFLKAAEQGHMNAQYELGMLYSDGMMFGSSGRTPHDFPQSIAWLRKAAAQGHAEAQFALGFMIEKGLGTIQDSAQALKWYHKAAEQGKMEHISHLADAYAFGLGVEQNEVIAFALYHLASTVEAKTSNLGEIKGKKSMSQKELSDLKKLAKAMEKPNNLTKAITAYLKQL